MGASDPFLVGLGTQSSDVDPNQQPQQPQPPANNAQNAGPVKAGLRGVLARMLGSFSYGAGQSMLKAAGDETDAERATRLAATAHLNAQTDLISQQAAQMKNLMPLTLPDGTTIHVPQAFGGKILEAMVKGQYGVQGQLAAKRFTAIPNVGLIDTQAQGGPQLVPGSGPQAVTVTPEIAQQYNVPQQLIGKTVPLQQFVGLERGGSMQITPVMGAQGPALVNKNTKEVTKLGLGNPGVASATARAAVTPFETVDANGQPTTISNAQAIASGAPGIGRTNLTQVKGKQALIDDIRGGIQQVRDLSSVIDRPGVKLKVAAALADPGLTTQTVLQSPIVGSMQPDEQQYVINLLNLKENAMAMRSVLGAGQGSEDLRTAITKTIPSAMTPNSRYANMQLDTFSKTLDRLSKGIPQVAAPNTNPKPPSQKPNSGGFNWNSFPVKR